MVNILQVFLFVSYGTFDWHADALVAMAKTIAIRIMYLPRFVSNFALMNSIINGDCSSRQLITAS
ncbi:hypothetical protein CN311_25115 [Mesorhizobium sanjuanii]|uniref:Uncharacterized protein n=1 Tax=Mesorhizobium sanjuanii TaxID=2037900 RepID=A0A2A6F9F5_9HYPH|nr:hypothetical protein CN311_25115 [Mesorhizobium sanjuanii]